MKLFPFLVPLAIKWTAVVSVAKVGALTVVTKAELTDEKFVLWLVMIPIDK